MSNLSIAAFKLGKSDFASSLNASIPVALFNLFLLHNEINQL